MRFPNEVDKPSDEALPVKVLKVSDYSHVHRVKLGRTVLGQKHRLHIFEAIDGVSKIVVDKKQHFPVRDSHFGIKLPDPAGVLLSCHAGLRLTSVGV